MSIQGGSANLDDIIEQELKAISAKRKKCDPAEGMEKTSNLFGIALSGGGIRSATVNLGVLKILNKCGILSKADYLSTVSGGGYIGGYIHTKLSGRISEKGLFNELFSKDDLLRLMAFGNYLAPRKGLMRVLDRLRLGGTFVFSVVMNLVWVLSLFFSVFFLLQTLFNLAGSAMWDSVWGFLCLSTVVVLSVHFFLHGLRHIKLWPSNLLYYAEGILLLFTIIYLFYRPSDIFLLPPPGFLLASLLVLIITGFFANPNILTMHRFYGERLAAAYLETAGKGYKSVKLTDLIHGQRPDDWGCAPYPLINTCLNLMGEKDTAFKGAKTSDYFLLSPIYCGSGLTGYINTSAPGYKNMTVSTAVAISGAAVNPNMGTRTNKVLSFLMTILNLKMGYWALNPKPGFRSTLSRLAWWPYYLMHELMSSTDTKRWRVNISDGGHIENLGVFELLRRKCRLIIAIDASADPGYSFGDLQNLVIRAREQLGIAITFRHEQDPEQVIRPMPSKGFSESHFAIADIEELPGKGRDRIYTGILVYMKSSLRAPQQYKRVESRSELHNSYIYKRHHPAFPHESTADQFFDEAQWRAYYDLGRFMAGDLLGVNVLKEEEVSALDCGAKTINELYNKFDGIKDRTGLEEYLKYMA